MRTTLLFLLLLAPSWLLAQTTCPWSNSSGTFPTDVAPDITGHTTGNHTMTSANGSYTCSYSGGPGLCTTTLKIGIPSPVIAESGHLSGTGACHAHNVNTSTPSSVGPGQVSATGAAGGGVVNCFACQCNVVVNMNPGGGGVTVTPNPVWSHNYPLTATCPAEYGNTIPQCSGSPGFACGDGGSPECVNGQWQCSNGGTGCTLPPPYCGSEGVQCTGTSWQCTGPSSPIIIDTDGKGFHLTDAANGVRFDLSGIGHPQQLSWTAQGSTNGWLALPADDGTITSGKQLFGDFTPQPPSEHPNGFLALAVYDQPDHGGNGDGVIDWRDAIWPKLRIWIDGNHNGVAEASELYALPTLGVISLDLKYTDTRLTDAFGNLFRYKGTVNPEGQPTTDPVDRVMYDVFLTNLSTVQSKQLVLRDKLQ